MERADVAVVGGGIVGLATARAILRGDPRRSVVVIEKEAHVGAHQSGRNSGVIHAGVYYRPGSEKARMCTAGRLSMVRYCQEHGIDHAVTGKVVVATDEVDRARLADLEQRCIANGVRTELIGPERLRELEPHVAGVAALHVLDTGIVDYGEVCRSLAKEIEAADARLHLGATLVGAREITDGIVLETTDGPVEARRVVTCAGLHADEVARVVSGEEVVDGVRVIAFRGEYREIVPARARISCARSCTPSPIPRTRSSACTSPVASTAPCTWDPTRCSRSRARATSGAGSMSPTCARPSDSAASGGSPATTGGSVCTRWPGRSAGAGSPPPPADWSPSCTGATSCPRRPGSAPRPSDATASSSTTS